MTYADFKKKWLDHNLVSGTEECREGHTITELISEADDSHFLFLPSYLGWKNDSQRVKFYKDARALGFVPVQGEKRTWRRAIQNLKQRSTEF